MSTDVMIPPRTMLEVYESLPEGTPVQLIQNKLVMSPSPLTRHQQVLLHVANLITNFIKEHEVGVVFIAPYDVHLDKKNVYQPDILFIANENLHKIRENGFYGAPDLVIEILSPGTAMYDRTEKKEIYEQYGVKEYWIIDPKTKKADGFWLEKGKFKAVKSEDNMLRLKILDLNMDI